MMRALSLILAGIAAVSAAVTPEIVERGRGGDGGGRAGRWTEVGSCIADGGRDRVFKSTKNLGLLRQVFENNTPEVCQAACAAEGYGYAAVRMGVECWCSADPPNLKGTHPRNCQQPCAGNDKTNCGGYSASRVFAHSRLAGQGAARQEGVARLANKWSVVSKCAVDPTVGENFLRNSRVFELKNNSPFACTRFCGSNGYDLAAVEYSNECMCAKGWKGPSLPQARPESECYMACPGDKTLSCGAGHRVQIYKHADFRGRSLLDGADSE